MDAVCSTEITNLAPGSYIVRVAAVADESFVMSVTINAAAKDEPTEPTVNITYDIKMEMLMLYLPI